MTIKESIEQLESLVEAWNLDEADLNQTDINAIKCLLNNRQELIDYLKEKIEERNKGIKLIGQDVYTSKYAYEEILSKIEKSDK